MTIIVEGDLERLKQDKVFTCRYCGCIFEADNTEYSVETSLYNDTYYSCTCPTCENKVYIPHS